MSGLVAHVVEGDDGSRFKSPRGCSCSSEDDGLSFFFLFIFLPRIPADASVVAVADK